MIDASLIFDGTLATTGTGVPTGAAITATRVSGNVIDLLTSRDVGVGDELELHVTITEAFSTGDTNTASMTVDFETCATAGGSYDVLIRSPDVAKANLIVGAKIFAYKLPKNQLNSASLLGGRFIRLNYTCTGAAFTAGKVFSYMTGLSDRQSFAAYPANYSIAS